MSRTTLQHHPEKYYLTVPFAEFPKRFGTHSSASPRHMTVLPWFRLRRYSDEANMLVAVGEYCQSQSPFFVTFGDVKGYGANEDEPGQPVVAEREQVIALHCGLLAVVGNWAEVLDSTWVGAEGYREPHSSLVGEQPFDGSPVSVRSVLVVAKYAKGLYRLNEPDKELVDGFRLGGKLTR